MTAEQAAEPAAPKLIHSGTYALWETPDGGRHVVYCRSQSAAEDGTVAEVEGAPDEHLPTIPPEALPLVSHFLEHGIPPQIAAVLRGDGAGRLAGLRAMLAGLGDPSGDG